MDDKRFDAMTRALAAAANRRSLFKSAALALGALAPLGRARALAPGAYCGVTCADSGENCDGATDGCYTCCDPMCVDTTTDPNNCGNCGTVCAGGQYAVCVNATCSIQCPDGFTACGDGSYCADLANDPQNCISCGDACPEGQTCCGALGCIDLTIDLHNCGACGTDCGVDGRCCASTCIDPNADDGNCGDCGAVCAPDQTCRGGTCRSRCPSDQLFCDQDCVDPQNDAANCGGCGVVCAETERCQGGVCVSTCAAGTTDCGTYCADLTGDQNNCGGCGIVCSRDTACQNGHCIRPECPKGQTRCQDGCFDLTTDANHCGGCNNLCLNGDFTCCGGACIDLKTDPNHCGRCDFACPPGYRCDGKGCVLEASGTGSAGESRLASPDFCVTKARTQAEIDALFSSTAHVSPTATPNLAWSTIVKGVKVKPKLASTALTQTITDTVVAVSACGSANDPARQTALMTDRFAGAWVAEQGFTAETLTTAPVPLRPESWSVLSSISAVFELGGGLASALVEFAPLGPTLPPRREIHVYKQTGKRWLLDAVRPEVPLTAQTGSLLARLFNCPFGASASDRCEPTPELLFGYELASADGSFRKSAADAKFIDAGLLLWTDLTPGVVHLRPIMPTGAEVHITAGASVTPRGEFIGLVRADADPVVIDLFHERSAIVDAVLKLNADADCPPCSRKDSLQGICAPTCPACSNCRSVRRADGTFFSICQPACAAADVCGPAHQTEFPECCAPEGAACAKTSDCCGENACQNEVCGCATAGSSCAQAACCAGNSCTGSKPLCAACKPLGETCASNEECCDHACFDGTCQCCAGVDEGDSAKTQLCCVYPQTTLSVPKTSNGPAFTRCCTPGVDCFGDTGGPPLIPGVAYGQGVPRVCRS
jgi:hypothetical protein